MEQSRSQKPLIYGISALVISLIAILLMLKQCSGKNSIAPKSNTAQNDIKTIGEVEKSILDSDAKDEYSTPVSLALTPEELVGEIHSLIVKANDTGDIDPLINFMGKAPLTPGQSERLQQLASQSRLTLNTNMPFSAVENHPNRWSLNLANRQRILLDIEKNSSSKWQVQRVILPNETASITQNKLNSTPHNGTVDAATMVVTKFMDAILNLDPISARSYVDSKKINYAQLAGLCIIFEEGKYKLTETRSIRKMFLQKTSAGWLAQLTSEGREKNAVFSITTKRKDEKSAWKITEINLDQLLADYAGRFSNGDIHYIPLIKNPKGGESLAIYFDLDSENLTTRTKRQLAVVANLLKNDSEKGVKGRQIEIIGYGKSQPRRPNTTEDGQDAPDGRRANRRAEILLNF